MSRKSATLAAILGFAGLFVLHQDLWWWDDAQLIAGLPIGLAYHVAYCGLVSLLLALVVEPLTRDAIAEDPPPALASEVSHPP